MPRQHGDRQHGDRHDGDRHRSDNSLGPIADGAPPTRPAIASLWNRCDELGDFLIDLAVTLLLIVAPFALGGRHPIGKFLVVSAAVPGTIGLLLKVLAGKRVPLSFWQTTLLLGCPLIAWLQTQQLLPADWLFNARGWQQLFPSDNLLFSVDSVGDTPSIAPLNTQRSLPLLGSYVCIFTFVVIRLRSYSDLQRILRLVMIATALMACVALLQASFGNGRFLWFYDHPTRDPGTIPRAAFQNENHLSNFLAIGLPCALFWLLVERQSKKAERRCSTPRHSDWRKHRKYRQSRNSSNSATGMDPAALRDAFDLHRLAAIATCILVVVTVYRTPSRGGAAVVGVAACVFITVVAAVRTMCNRLNNAEGPLANQTLRVWMRRGLSGVVVCSGVAVALVYANIDRLSYWRSKLWAADLAIWRDFPVFGVGVGNHRFIYRAYLDEYYPQTFSTAESSWIQLLVETGAVGIIWATLCTATVLLSLGSVLMRRLNTNQLLLAGCLAACLFTSLLHSFFDFPWHIPACFLPLLCIAAAAIRLPTLLATAGTAPSESQYRSLPIGLSSSLAALLVLLNLWAVQKSLPMAQASMHWDAFSRLARDYEGLSDPKASRVAHTHLMETLRHDPNHFLARAQYLSAQTARYEAARFHSESAQQLAEKILQACRHFSLACPTESRTYVYAAAVTDALDPSPKKKAELLEQARRLRLTDGHAALLLGLQAMIAQSPDEADQHFHDAVHLDPSYAPEAIQMLARLFPPSEIIARWSPDQAAAQKLHHVALQTFDRDEQLVAGRYFCQCLISNAGNASPAYANELLHLADKVASGLNDPDTQYLVVERRLQFSPNNGSLLLQRARLHLRLNRTDDARRDLRQCLTLNPSNQDARRLVYELDRAGVRTAAASEAE